jgi:hypothetical protein
VHERRQSPDLEAARDAANLALNQTQKQVQALARQVEELKAKDQDMARSASAAALMKTNGVRSGQTATPSLASGGRSIARNHQELVHLQKRSERHYREFTLTPWKHSERIGPIGLTVLQVDPEHKFLDLSITVDNLTPKRKRVNLYEPVWIDWNGRPRAVELVFNRIDRDRMQGYLSEPKYRRIAGRRAPLSRSSG